MKLITIASILTVASAITVFNGEDNVAMETQSERARYTKGRETEERKSIRDGNRSEKKTRSKPKDVVAEESKNLDGAPEILSEENPNAYFAHIEGDSGHTHGFSSYIQHVEEKDALQEGSHTEIKKLVPKSSVQFEMYLGKDDKPSYVPSKHQYREVKHAKPKKPIKFHSEVLDNYKKLQTKPLTSLKDFPNSAIPSFSPLPSVTKKPEAPTPRKKPYEEIYTEYEFPENINPESLAEALSSATNDAFLKSSFSNDNSWKPISNNAEFSTSSLKPKKTRRAKDIPANFFSTPSKYSDKGKQFGGDVRIKPNGFDHEKALRGSTVFDIENVVKFTGSDNPFEGRALPSPTNKFTSSDNPFEGHVLPNPTNKFTGGDNPFEGHVLPNPTNKFTGGDNPFEGRALPSPTKPFEGRPLPTLSKPFVPASSNIGSRGPVQFSNLPNDHTTRAPPLFRNYEFPAISEQDFDKQFARFRNNDAKKYEFTSKYRTPHDLRTLSNKPQLYHKAAPPKKFKNIQYQNFSQSLAQHNKGRELRGITDVDLFPTLKLSQTNKKNVSVLPERYGRVLPDNNDPKHQFSVSASYQIDRNIGKSVNQHSLAQ